MTAALTRPTWELDAACRGDKSGIFMPPVGREAPTSDTCAKPSREQSARVARCEITASRTRCESTSPSASGADSTRPNAVSSWPARAESDARPDERETARRKERVNRGRAGRNHGP